MTPRESDYSSPSAEGSARLEARVRDDLAHLLRPGAPWVPERRDENGAEVVDVVIIGAGMCGLAAAFALLSAGVRKLRILDRQPAGLEGPWRTHARMETLRSPKHLVGPACGMASLTFRAWFTAGFGPAAWEALGHIPTGIWMDYLVWYRKVLELPVENEVEVRRIRPEARGLRLELAGEGARETSLRARKVVLASGRDGVGRAHIPAFVAPLPRARWAHASEEIDFASLRGRRVVVIGAGASAVDNAALALEAGAAEVRHLIRRAEMPTVNKLMGIANPGFAAGFAGLSDDWRWRFMHHALACQTPAPRASTQRVGRHENAHFHFGAGIARAAMVPGGVPGEVPGEAAGEIELETTAGARLRTDYLILGTGFTVEPAIRPEFAGWGEEILLWRHRHTAPAGLESAELGAFPYLDRDFAFIERRAGKAPWLARLHCFNHGAMLSLGKLSGDIPDVSQGALLLAREIAARLYGEDVEIHWRHMLDYDEAELLGDEWRASPLPGDEGAAAKRRDDG